MDVLDHKLHVAHVQILTDKCLPATVNQDSTTKQQILYVNNAFTPVQHAQIQQHAYHVQPPQTEYHQQTVPANQDS